MNRNWNPFQEYLSWTDLVSKCQLGNDIFLKHRSQGIWEAHRVSLEAMEHFPTRPVILFGLDALPYNFFHSHFGDFCSKNLHPVTSVIPSTSTCCWASILTGLIPEQHGIHGVVFFDPALGLTAHALRPLVCNSSSEWVQALSPPSLVDSNALIFSKALGLHSRKSFSIGRLAFEEAGPLHQQLNAGASNSIPDDYDNLISQPLSLVHANFECIRRKLGEGHRFGFAYFNFDTFLHENTYDSPALIEAVEQFIGECKNLVADYDAICVIVSDHGMIKQSGVSLDCPFADVYLKSISYAPPGGAGRVLYYYLKLEFVADGIKYLEDLLGGDALVFRRGDYMARFLDANAGPIQNAERIGDVVVVANSASFPSVMCQSVHEHGSLSESEMFATLGVVM